MKIQYESVGYIEKYKTWISYKLGDTNANAIAIILIFIGHRTDFHLYVSSFVLMSYLRVPLNYILHLGTIAIFKIKIAMSDDVFFYLWILCIRYISESLKKIRLIAISLEVSKNIFVLTNTYSSLTDLVQFVVFYNKCF